MDDHEPNKQVSNSDSGTPIKFPCEHLKEFSSPDCKTCQWSQTVKDPSTMWPQVLHLVKEVDDYERSGESCPYCYAVVEAYNAAIGNMRASYPNIHPYNLPAVVKVVCTPHAESLGTGGRTYPSFYINTRPEVREEGIPYSWRGPPKKRGMLPTLSQRLALVKSWLDECLTSHPTCAYTPQESPRRLLKISTSSIRLVENPTTVERYAALSYCWGPNGNFTTVKANLESYIQGIPIESLPRTISDAVQVCCALDLTYLWVDALCILQDDEEDWISQIPLMSSFYSGAAITIAVQGSETVQDGFLDMQQYIPGAEIEIEGYLDGVPGVLPLSIEWNNIRAYGQDIPSHFNFTLRKTGPKHLRKPLPLGWRAWAFQERFLSPRMLFCTPSEFSWQCSQHSQCECVPKPHMISDDAEDFIEHRQLATALRAKSHVLDDAAKVRLWLTIVASYSALKLSVLTDRLPALQGVVEALAQNFPETFKLEDYFFGCWKSAMRSCLAWERQGSEQGPEGPGVPEGLSLPETSFPSWSWAASSGKITYPSLMSSASVLSPQAEKLLDILDLKVEYGSGKKSVGTGKGWLTISGYVIPITRHNAQGLVFKMPETFRASPAEVQLDDPSRESAESCAKISHFLLLDAGTVLLEGMFLVPVGESEKQVFRRIGYGNHGTPPSLVEFEVLMDKLKPFRRVVTLV